MANLPSEMYETTEKFSVGQAVVNCEQVANDMPEGYLVFPRQRLVIKRVVEKDGKLLGYRVINRTGKDFLFVLGRPTFSDLPNVLMTSERLDAISELQNSCGIGRGEQSQENLDMFKAAHAGTKWEDSE